MAQRKQSDSVRKMRLIILGLTLALVLAVVAVTWFTLSREAENGEIQWRVSSTASTSKKIAGEPDETTTAASGSDTLTTTGVDGLPYAKGGSDAFAEWNGKHPSAEVVVKKDEKGVWSAYVGEKKAPDCTGVYNNENGWWFVRDGVVDRQYTGIAANEKGQWYIDGGHANFGYTGTFNPLDSDKHYTVIEGKVVQLAQ
ncbi:MAG: hypothetical protein IJ714_05795 [Bacteroidales bacterium]|nr:hypothetical protein [Clostridia bacterium]MBR1699279.1 hypothetical protein [Bacteroidales bacterium]